MQEQFAALHENPDVYVSVILFCREKSHILL